MPCGDYNLHRLHLLRFDGTNEESYFFMGAGAIERGHPLILYEGPGQSAMIREYNIKFTLHWHKPVSKILDYIEANKVDLKSRKKILVGISFGGILVGRAAAVEKRIDGIIMWGNVFDWKTSFSSEVPSLFISWLESGKRKKLFNFISNLAFDFEGRWRFDRNKNR